MTVEITTTPLDALSPADFNPRYITEDRFAALKRALAADPEMLFARPLIALRGVDYAPDGTVIAGNMRLRALLSLREDGAAIPASIPVAWTTIDEARSKVWMLRDNQEYGEWEDQALAEILTELRDQGIDLDLTGFPEGDVQMILDGVGHGPERFPELDEQATDYECPSCGYGWSGLPKPSSRSAVEPAAAAPAEEGGADG